jgi:hypothetical protein
MKTMKTLLLALSLCGSMPPEALANTCVAGPYKVEAFSHARQSAADLGNCFYSQLVLTTDSLDEAKKKLKEIKSLHPFDSYKNGTPAFREMCSKHKLPALLHLYEASIWGKDQYGMTARCANKRFWF